jgi:hypothetical protein
MSPGPDYRCDAYGPGAVTSVEIQLLGTRRPGRGRIIALAAECGAGRTALTGRFVADRARQAQTYWGSCENLTIPPGYCCRFATLRAPAVRRCRSEAVISSALRRSCP